MVGVVRSLQRSSILRAPGVSTLRSMRVIPAARARYAGVVYRARWGRRVGIVEAPATARLRPLGRGRRGISGRRGFRWTVEKEPCNEDTDAEANSIVK